MEEAFLHFIWQSRSFEAAALSTRDGEPVRIIHPGRLNNDQGPDFLDAHVEIGKLVWHGSVEIHVDGQDWYRHGHESDPFYNNTVLHVVMHGSKKPVRRQDGTRIPEVTLAGRISNDLVDRYKRLRLSSDAIPCAATLPHVPPRLVRLWMESLGVERILNKAQNFRRRLQDTGGDWDQLVFEEIAAALAGPVNQVAFREISRRLPVRKLQQSRQSPLRLAALVFGAAGLLATEKPREDVYYQQLRQLWLTQAAGLRLPTTPIVPLKFHRMRPAAFPTLRIAQLVSILCLWPRLTFLLDLHGIREWLHTTISPDTYWRTHYRFGKTHDPRNKDLGKQQKEGVLINTLVPLGALYRKVHGHADPNHLIENILGNLPAERNRLTRPFEKANQVPQNALQSQGAIDLNKYHCQEKRCLSCQIGYHIVRKPPPKHQ